MYGTLLLGIARRLRGPVARTETVLHTARHIIVCEPWAEAKGGLAAGDYCDVHSSLLYGDHVDRQVHTT